MKWKQKFQNFQKKLTYNQIGENDNRIPLAPTRKEK